MIKYYLPLRTKFCLSGANKSLGWFEKELFYLSIWIGNHCVNKWMAFLEASNISLQVVPKLMCMLCQCMPCLWMDIRWRSTNSWLRCCYFFRGYRYYFQNPSFSQPVMLSAKCSFFSYHSALNSPKCIILLNVVSYIGYYCVHLVHDCLLSCGDWIMCLRPQFLW